MEIATAAGGLTLELAAPSAEADDLRLGLIGRPYDVHAPDLLFLGIRGKFIRRRSRSHYVPSTTINCNPLTRTFFKGLVQLEMLIPHVRHGHSVSLRPLGDPSAK